MGLWTWIASLFLRPPDFIVGGAEKPYLLRWWLIPRSRWFNVYLHKFVRDDDDRAYHDHPWPSLSIVLAGGYFDWTPGPDGSDCRRWYGPGSVIFRRAVAAHRVQLMEVQNGVFRPGWTLFITGPRVREWGFLCPQGWRHWKEFTDGKDGERVGKGCD